MKYRPEIDGLRAVAVIPVILYHAGYDYFKGGFIGVDVFFVISGYLITHLILDDISQGTFSLKSFYERRARRILPALFFVMIWAFVLSIAFLDPRQLKSFFKSLISVSLFTSNFQFWLESSYWGISSELKPLLHTWSLAVEEQYYLIFPLLVMLIWRFNKRRLTSILFILVLSSLILAQLFSVYLPDANFYLLPTRFWELGLGALLAVLLNKFQPQFLNKGGAQSNLLSILGLLLIFYSMLFFDSDTLHPSFMTFIPVLGTCLIIAFSSPYNITGKILVNPGFIQIGLISYSAYLWHQVLFSIARHASLEDLSDMLTFGLLILTFLLAFLTYKFIETPFRKRTNMTQKQVFLASIIGSVFFICIGTYGTSYPNQFSMVYSKEYQARQSNIRQLGKERTTSVSQHECHHMKSGKLKNLNDFFDNWDCTGKTNQAPFESKIAVFGDSHAADKAWMFRVYGFDLFQVGGTGCSLLYKHGNRCGKLLQFFHQKAQTNDVHTVFIANHFSEKELTINYLRRLVKDWSSRYQKVYLFSPMPKFPYWKKKYFRKGIVEYKPDFSSHELFYKNLSEINLPENIHIIDTSKLICSKSKNCDLQLSENQFPFIDTTHISSYGAKIFGNRLINQLKNMNHNP